MTAMSNITVKGFDGVTDNVWTAVQSSGGDRMPAIWRNTTGGFVNTAPLFAPEMRLASRPNVDGSVRRMTGSVDFKQTTQNANHLTVKGFVCTLKFEAILPQGMDPSYIDELSAQAPALINAALIRECLRIGYAPTN